MHNFHYLGEVPTLHLVLHGFIDPVDQPGESLPVDRFSQSISSIDGVIDRERAEDLHGETKSQLKRKFKEDI